MRPGNSFFVRLYDWLIPTFVLDLLLCGLIYGLAYGMLSAIPINCRPFILADPTLSYPYESHEMVTTGILALLVVVPPVVILALVSRLNFRSPAMYLRWLTLVEAVAATSIITEGLKVFTGKFRPDWLSRLQHEQLLPTFPSNTPSSIGVLAPGWENLCLDSPKILRDGRAAFPSGHSSCIFTACTIVSLHLAAVLRIYRPKGGHLWKLTVVLLPYLLAAWVAGTRVFDHRHSFDDISIGAILGIILAVLCYRLHFPALNDLNPEKPYLRPKFKERFSEATGPGVGVDVGGVHGPPFEQQPNGVGESEGRRDSRRVVLAWNPTTSPQNDTQNGSHDVKEAAMVPPSTAPTPPPTYVQHQFGLVHA